MTLPNLFYAEPQFRASSPALAQLKQAKHWTLQTPGITFALATDYYRVEAFATERDRDAACGPTAHEDVRYVSADRRDLDRENIRIADIACGYPVDHPRFDEIVTPIFEAALKRLIRDLMEAPKGQPGIVASTLIPIARTRYKISAEQVGEWINFPVDGLTVFEKADQDLVSRTVEWLENRLKLTASRASDPN